jgi:hypothetical protein
MWMKLTPGGLTRVYIRKGKYLFHKNSQNSREPILQFECFTMFPDAVFLVLLSASSFPARHEVHRKTTENLVPIWERAHTQH